MRRPRLSRRGLLLGGGVALAGAAAAAVAWPDRPQLRRWLSPLGIRLGDERPEPAPAYDDGWLLTAEERAALERADASAASEVLELRDGVELRSEPYDARRVADLQACVAACEEDARCAAFTYARASHPSAGERRRCRLTAEPGEPVSRRPHHVSGRRGGW